MAKTEQESDEGGNGGGPHARREAFELKVGLAEMLKGGVIMDVTTAEQAKIAEDAGRLRGDGARARARRHPQGRRRRAHDARSR